MLAFFLPLNKLRASSYRQPKAILQFTMFIHMSFNSEENVPNKAFRGAYEKTN